MAHSLFWPSWVLATATTGIVAGFMLSHTLLLGRFLDWLLASGRADVLAATYPVFAHSAGAAGLAVFYAISGMQVAASLGFLGLALAVGRHRALATVAGVMAIAWPVAHYVSGFGALERRVLRSTTEAAADVARAFVEWNVPVHTFHTVALAVGLGALLLVPVVEARERRP